VRRRGWSGWCGLGGRRRGWSMGCGVGGLGGRVVRRLGVRRFRLLGRLLLGRLLLGRLRLGRLLLGRWGVRCRRVVVRMWWRVRRLGAGRLRRLGRRLVLRRLRRWLVGMWLRGVVRRRWLGVRRLGVRRRMWVGVRRRWVVGRRVVRWWGVLVGWCRVVVVGRCRRGWLSCWRVRGCRCRRRRGRCLRVGVWIRG
jgi:hypothetical protein